MAFAGGFVLEFVAVGVGDALNGQKERVVEALGGDVFDGNGAVKSVPAGAVEMRVNGLGDIDRAGAMARATSFAGRRSRLP